MTIIWKNLNKYIKQVLICLMLLLVGVNTIFILNYVNSINVCRNITKNTIDVVINQFNHILDSNCDSIITDKSLYIPLIKLNIHSILILRNEYPIILLEIDSKTSKFIDNLDSVKKVMLNSEQPGVFTLNNIYIDSAQTRKPILIQSSNSKYKMVLWINSNNEYSQIRKLFWENAIPASSFSFIIFFVILSILKISKIKLES